MLGAIQALDEMSSELQAFSEDILAVRDAVSTVAKARSRQVKDIRKLPEETLCQIFEYIASPSQLVAVGGVCRMFRLATMKLTKGWAHVESVWHTSFVKLCIERSTVQPLTIVINDCEKGAIDEFLDIVVPLRSRWRSLDIDTMKYNGIGGDNIDFDVLKGMCSRLRALDLPSLEVLHVKQNAEDDYEETTFSVPTPPFFRRWELRISAKSL